MASGTMRNLLEADELTDMVTGLIKPGALETHLYLALIRARTTGHQVVVIVADVDDFSGIITDRGWRAGDQILAQVAERFDGCLRDDDMVARMFGDVFAGVCEDIEDSSTITLIVKRLAKVFARPFTIDGEQVPLLVNLGTAVAEPGDRPEQAIRRAENAIGRPAARGRSA